MLHCGTVLYVPHYSLIVIIVVTLHLIFIVGISKIRTFLSYGHCPVPWCPVKGGSTVSSRIIFMSSSVISLAMGKNPGLFYRLSRDFGSNTGQLDLGVFSSTAPQEQERKGTSHPARNQT